jgi:hypothetical protein
LVERLIRNQQVSGSIPEGGSIKSTVRKIGLLPIALRIAAVILWPPTADERGFSPNSHPVPASFAGEKLR